MDRGGARYSSNRPRKSQSWSKEPVHRLSSVSGRSNGSEAKVGDGQVPRTLETRIIRVYLPRKTRRFENRFLLLEAELLIPGTCVSMGDWDAAVGVIDCGWDI